MQHDDCRCRLLGIELILFGQADANLLRA